MMNLSKKQPWLYSSLLVSAALFADSSMDDTTKKSASPMPAYGDTARIQVDRSWDMFTSASFTYWEPLQERMEMGIVGDTSSSLFALKGESIKQENSYKPGFKVGLGMNWGYDAWDTFMQYTWFRGTFHTNKHFSAADKKVIFPTWQVPAFTSPTYYNLKSHWDLGMDIGDIEMARHYFAGEELSMRPFLGVRVAWIRQHLDVNYENATLSGINPYNVAIKQSTHSWGLGPRLGIDTNWMIGKGFRLYGTGSGDLLFTQYTEVEFLQSGTSKTGALVSGSVYSVQEKNLNYLKAHMELELGLGWGTYFAKNKWHIDFSAGYNFQMFVAQNLFRSFTDANALAVNNNGNANLYMDGLTANMRIDF